MPFARIHENISSDTQLRTTTRRDQLDRLRSRITLLDADDRLLIAMYLDNGNSFRQIARLARCNEVTIARRINRIIARLTDPRFERIIQLRHHLSKKQFEIAKDYFLRGLSLRRLADKHNISYYRAYQHVRTLKNLSRTDNNTKTTVRCY